MRNRKSNAKNEDGKGLLTMDDIAKIQEQIKNDQKKKKRPIKKADGNSKLFYFIFLFKILMMMKKSLEVVI